MFRSITQRLRRPGDSVVSQLERAQQARAQGDAAGALKIFESVLAARPEHAAAMLGSAATLEDLGRFDEAIAMLDRLLGAEPRNAGAIASKERVAERAGNGAAALAMWNELVQRFPDDAGYRVRRELLRLRAGDERVALRELVQLAQAAPDRGDLAEHAAQAARWLERSEDALKWFRAAASRLPQRSDLALEIVRELIKLERFEEARAALNALKSPPIDGVALVELTIAVRARLDPQDAQAQSAFERTTAPRTSEEHAREQPPQAPASPADAVAATAEGRRDESQRYLEDAHRRNAAFPLARWRARVALADGDAAAAIAAIASQVDDAAPVALTDARLAIRARIDAERIGDAWAELERHEPSFAARDLAEERADLLRADLRLDEELAHLRRRVHADPFDETFASRLADALLDRGDAGAAGEIIDAWSRRRPAGRVWFHKRLRLSWAAHREWPRLVADSRQILEDAPPHLQVHLTMDHVRVVRKSGDFDEADRLLDDFERRLPALALSRRERLGLDCEIAHELTWLGRHAEARPRFERLLEQPMSLRARDELYRLCCVNESYGGGDLQRFERLRNAISHPRHHLRITPFACGAGADRDSSAAQPRVLVLLHLYHGDLWPELRDRLAQLHGGAMHLAVGVGAAVTDDVLAGLKRYAPQAQVVRVENRGFDVGGHWQVLDQVDLRNFDLALVLQTKKSSHTRIGKVWRDQLVGALIGSPSRWQDNLRLFAQRPQLGLIGSGWHQSSFHPWSTPAMRDVLGALGMPLGFDQLKSTHRFVSGTMFLMRAGLLAEMHEKMRLPFERVEELSLARLSDDSRAHAMERAFGMYVAWRGYESCWRA